MVLLFAEGAEFDFGEFAFGVEGEVSVHHPVVVGGFFAEDGCYGFVFVFAEVEDFFAFVVAEHAAGEVYEFGGGEFGEDFDVVFDFTDLAVEGIGYGLAFVAFYLGDKYFHGRVGVGLGGVGVFEVFADVEFVGGGQGSLLHHVEDFLSVDDFTSAIIEFNSGPEEFLDEHGDVELKYVEAGEVCAFEELRVVFGNFFEGGFSCHVFIGQAVENGGFCRDWYGWVEYAGFPQDFSVGHHFNNRNFDDPVLGDVCSRCFEIENAKGISEIQLHVYLSV